MNNSNLTLRRVLPEAYNLNKQRLGVRVMWVLCCSSVGLTTWRHVAIDISTSGLGNMVWKSNNGTNFTILYPKWLHSLFPSLQAILFSRPPLHHKTNLHQALTSWTTRLIPLLIQSNAAFNDIQTPDASKCFNVDSLFFLVFISLYLVWTNILCIKTSMFT